MEKHTSKKLFAGILALSAGFVLAACDPVSAVPSNYKNAIVSSSDGAIDLEGNNLGSLYDSITSERNSKIVNDILAEIAEKKFGTYADFLDACSSAEKQTAFVNAHSEFFGTDENKDARFEAFRLDIEQRISEYFYNEITSGSYNDDLGKFSEEKLYNAHRYELYDLHKLDEAVAADKAVIDNKFFVDKELTKDNVFEVSATHPYLKGVYYNNAEGARGYIEEKVYPEILRNKLVEDYIYKNNPSSLGRAYARKVNYVKIAYEGESKFAETLMENFALGYIESAEELNFAVVENAFKGFVPSLTDNVLIAKPDTAVEALLAASATEGTIAVADDSNYKFMDLTIVPAGNYYKETKLGKILEEYAKAIKAETEGRFPTEENKSALESFTSDGKSKQYGLLQKVLSLMKEDYTTDGWYVKNGGLSDLPSAIRDRLFNIRVANTLDDGSLVLEHKATGEYTSSTMGDYEYVHEDGVKTEKKVTRLPYMRNIYGKKIVLPSKSLSFEKDEFNYIYHDRDSKALYICEVLEAPSTAKLNANSSSAYKKADESVDSAKIEEISRQVAKILGTKDSYIKDAYTEYLNKYEFTFFDTSLYDYFKSEYPDLDQFDD